MYKPQQHCENTLRSLNFDKLSSEYKKTKEIPKQSHLFIKQNFSLKIKYFLVLTSPLKLTILKTIYFREKGSNKQNFSHRISC